MTDDTYNGWANRETWLVNLWLSNDQDLLETALDLITEALAQHARDLADLGIDDDADRRARCVGEALNTWLCDDFQWTDNGFTTDLIRAALGRVDDAELGSAWLDLLNTARPE